MEEQSTMRLEVWMRGPVPNVPPLLQPVAHALLQAKEEIARCMQNFDDGHLWYKPGGAASPGFHLQHMTGVVDRMFTYALGMPLSEAQFAYLQSEGDEIADIGAAELVEAFGKQVDKAIDQLIRMDEAGLTDTRYLGRKRIPTTLIGLLFHAAEHTQRHVGQLLVTVKLLPLFKAKC
ncbi:DinB superfamily protein [Parapedobacter luteus]|uniref:DinB superfamily protein n=1 Tax=Parapedobacter luteus TaxID=623280 RepID=A0A1T5CFL9_9SPHI|nr:DinB family protein [Parapedobacter luteus]SKB58146.1 DinB superfamily protein [Parapedobacter luteus]